MKYLCPVCGYDTLSKPPSDYAICPCCATEFGHDDLTHSFDELRDRWIVNGARWFSSYTPAPPNWSVASQFANLLRRKPLGLTIANVTLSQFLGASVEVEEKRVAGTTDRVNIKNTAA